MRKNTYSKPSIKEIRLATSETVALGCWRAAPSSC